MKWKTLFWTIAVSILIFFVLVFLGMKFQWVRALQDKRILENEKIALEIPKNPPLLVEKPELVDEKKPIAENKTTEIKRSFPYALIGEEAQLVDFTGMPLELVVEECRRISKKVGVPKKRFTLSVNECATRNFQGKTSEEEGGRSRNVQIGLRKQCKEAIPTEQQELFSPEEIKLLVDECIADLHKKKNS